ncbi:PKD domain-containing protein [Calditrichota bacterium]
MLKKKLVCMLALVIFSVGTLFISCDKADDNSTGPSSNQAPVITGISADPSPVNPNGLCELKVVATDPDGDPLSYSWTASDGSFVTPADRDMVMWQAPESEGEFVVNVLVSDGAKSASEYKMVTVTPIPILEATPTILDFGTNDNTMSFSISNAGEEELTWSIDDWNDVDWITDVTPDNGSVTTSETEVSVSIDREDLEAGDHNDVITISSNGGSQTIDLSLEVLPGEWLSYDDGSRDDGMTMGEADGWCWTRFTRPDGWNSLSVSIIKINLWGGSSRSFNIDGNDTYITDEGNLYPPNLDWFTIESDVSQGTGWEEHIISPPVAFSNEEFFIGVGFLYDDGPAISYDENDPSTSRSGVTIISEDIIGILRFEWLIQIYVQEDNLATMSPPGNDQREEQGNAKGMWLEAEIEGGIQSMKFVDMVNVKKVKKIRAKITE